MTGTSSDGVVAVERRGRLTVLRLCGEVDADAVEDFWQRVSGVVPAVDLIDTGEVTFIGARGLSLLLAVQRRSRDLGHAGDLVRTAPCVERLLTVLDLTAPLGDPPPRPAVPVVTMRGRMASRRVPLSGPGD